MSVINRCTQTFAQDGQPAPVTLTHTDRFCLDGQRLRLTSSDDLSTYGLDSTTYGTEVESYAKVTAHGATGNGPASFTVQTRNGWTYEYGNGGNSQVLPNNGSTAVQWWVDKVTDRAGNTMTYTYQSAAQNSNLAGTTVPLSVSWTPQGAGSNSYNYQITFKYTTVASPLTVGYVAGTPFQNNYLLTNIMVQQATGTTLKNYVVSFGTAPNTARELLTSLQECSDSGATNCLQIPTTFTYQPGQAGISSTTTNLAVPSAIPVDLNADGRDDLLYTQNVSGTTHWYVQLATTTGFSSPIDTGITGSPANPQLILLDDFLGDGYIDVLVVINGTWQLYHWNNSTQSFTATPSNISLDANRVCTVGCYASADVDGDGLPDLLYGATDGGIYVRMNAGGGNFSTTPIKVFNMANAGYQNGFAGLFGNNGFPGSNVHHLHFDGTARDDLIVRVNTGAGFEFEVPLLSQGSTQAPSLVLPTGVPGGGSILPINWNDDPCTDVVLSDNSGNNTVYVAACNGTSAGGIGGIAAGAVAALDWDGDGRTDLLVNSSSGWKVYESSGVGIKATLSPTLPAATSGVMVLDQNGDGLDDLAFVNATGSAYALHNGAGQPPDLLSQAEDGYGNSVSPSYVSIMQNNYNAVLNPSFPGTPGSHYRYYIGPMYVTRQAIFSDPTNPPNGTYQHTFWYYDAWMSLQGRGFSGFKQRSRFDSRTGLWETTGYGGAFPIDGVFASDLLSHDQAGNQIVSSSWMNVVTVTLDGSTANQRSMNYYNNVTTQTYELGGPKDGQLIRTDHTNYAIVDNYANATTITRTITDNDSSSPYNNQTWTTTTTLTLDEDPAHWCLDLVSQAQVSYTSSIDGPPVTLTKNFTPDTGNCRYLQIVTAPNDPLLQVTEVRGYDLFGNINSDAVTGVNMATRTESIDWGATGQFPMRMTDPTGASIQLNYDFRYGRPSSLTDANNLQTTWTYGDGFGNLTQELRPDQTSTVWSLQSHLSCGQISACGTLRNVRSRTDRDTAGNTLGQSYVSLDPLERPTELGELTLTGGWNTTDIAYDPLGRTASRTMPFIWGAAQFTESYSYDVLNRMLQAQRPTSASNSAPVMTVYQYQGDTTIVTDPNGHAKTLTGDASGKLRKTQDATGYSVAFGYDAAGSHNNTNDSLGNTLWNATYKYGIGPLMVASNDADLGPWSYTYDALGEEVGWTDAKGQSFSAVYDALARMTDRYEPDLYSHWTYGTGTLNGQPAYNSGFLQAVCTGTGTNPTACTPASGYAENEVYDQYSRLMQRSIQIPGDATYTYMQAYNPTTGYPDTLTYPANPYGSALQVKYAYANGFLQSVTDVSDAPNVTFWTANAIDAQGHYLQETLGNRVVVNHGFDADTSAMTGITAGVSGGNALQNTSYLFDNVGNLTQRQDNNATTTENAYPDVLNRLDHTVGDSNTQLSYDTMGRLATWRVYNATQNVNDYVTQSAGCTYYGYAQPHALRRQTQGTNVTTYCYDRNGNLTGSAGPSSTTNLWTSYNQPNIMTGGSNTSQFFYDDDHQRWKQLASYNGSSETTTYIGGLLEKVSNSAGTQYRYYVPAGNNFVVYIDASTSTKPASYYATRDHLGSIAALTDQNGTLIANEKFSATGINETNAQQLTAAAKITRHEYTGEEGIDNFFLTNLNGRTLDPNRTQMLSPDPYIPDPTDTRSYNPYAYVSYNPLSLVDPSGYDDQPPPPDVQNPVQGACAGDEPCITPITQIPIGGVPEIPLLPPAVTVSGSLPATFENVGTALSGPNGGMYAPYPTQAPPITGPEKGGHWEVFRDYLFDPPDADMGVWSRRSKWIPDSFMGNLFTNVGNSSGIGFYICIFDGGCSGSQWAKQGAIVAANIIPVTRLGTLSVDAARAAAATVPGRVLSRINISNAGWAHVLERHFLGSGSRFSIGEGELRSLLGSRQVVGSPVVRILASAEGTRFLRQIDMGRTIGLDKLTGADTSILSVLSDKFGNLVTAFPGVLQ